MHELPATKGMLEVALGAARDAGAGRIREIHLVVGELTSIVDDSVQFYFDLMARGTPAEGARLVFRREPALLRCLDCGHREEVTPPLAPSCPACGSLGLEVTGGDAFRVDSLEADDEPLPPGSWDRPASAVPSGRLAPVEPPRVPPPVHRLAQEQP